MTKLSSALLYLVYFALVAGLLLAVIAAFHTGQAKPPAAPQAPRPTSQNTARPKAATALPSKSAPTSSSGSSSSGISQQLSNTGPGDTIGLFVGASLLGAVSYRQVLLRKRVG